jgi:hypothetical protein
MSRMSAGKKTGTRDRFYNYGCFRIIENLPCSFLAACIVIMWSTAGDNWVVVATRGSAQDVAEMSSGVSSEGGTENTYGATLNDDEERSLAAWFASASWHGDDARPLVTDNLPPISDDDEDYVNTTQQQQYHPAARIVGGSAASSVESYPYVVLLAHKGSVKCAGSLIGPRLVLSAGHCAGADTVYVNKGSNKGDDGGSSYGFHSYSVRRESRHPSFESPGINLGPYCLDNIKPCCFTMTRHVST